MKMNEITEGGGPDPLPGQQATEGRVFRPRISRRIAVITAGTILLAGAGVGTGLALKSGPSYPHQWCYPAEALMNGKQGMTQGAYESKLARIKVPEVQRLDGDLQNYDVARLMVENGSVLDAMPNFAREKRALKALGVDLRAIDRACGVPAPDAAHQNI